MAGSNRTAREAAEDEILWLAALTSAELTAKVASVEADVDRLQQEAEWSQRRAAEANRALDKLKMVAARRSTHADSSAPDTAPDRSAEGREAVASSRKSETAREAVLTLLREDPTRPWTPQLAYDELRRRGHQIARTAVQTALQRLAEDERVVRRVRAGTYQAGSAPAAAADVANGHVPEQWLTPEILQRIAEEAQVRFALKHPGVADGDFLVAEAKRRVAVWVDGHGRDPDDQAHVKRLMKTGLYDHYRRSQNGSLARPRRQR